MFIIISYLHCGVPVGPTIKGGCVVCAVYSQSLWAPKIVHSMNSNNWLREFLSFFIESIHPCSYYFSENFIKEKVENVQVHTVD